ncbi:hypothetical protein ARSEF4850_007938 [Beauveria asiatica]
MKFSTIFVAAMLSGLAAAAFDDKGCKEDVDDQCGSCTVCRNETGESLKACHKRHNDCVRSFSDYYGVDVDHCVLGGNLCHPE